MKKHLGIITIVVGLLFGLVTVIGIFLFAFKVILFGANAGSVSFLVVDLFLLFLFIFLCDILNKRKVENQKAELKKAIEQDKQARLLALYKSFNIPPQRDKNGNLINFYELLGIEPQFDQNGERVPTVYELLQIVPTFTQNINGELKEVPTVLFIKNHTKSVLRANSEAKQESVLVKTDSKATTIPVNLEKNPELNQNNPKINQNNVAENPNNNTIINPVKAVAVAVSIAKVQQALANLQSKESFEISQGKEQQSPGKTTPSAAPKAVAKGGSPSKSAGPKIKGGRVSYSAMTTSSGKIIEPQPLSPDLFGFLKDAFEAPKSDVPKSAPAPVTKQPQSPENQPKVEISPKPKTIVVPTEKHTENPQQTHLGGLGTTSAKEIHTSVNLSGSVENSSATQTGGTPSNLEDLNNIANHLEMVNLAKKIKETQKQEEEQSTEEGVVKENE